MQKITPYLWFDGKAEEAANHYAAVFDNCKITEIRRFGPGGPGPEGSVLTVTFEIDGQQLVALNGGPEFAFTEAISFYVDCRDQEEVDRLWEKLSEGGEPGHCGWLKDRFGVSWQIVPRALGELMGDPDPEKATRVTQAMLGMGKIEIQGLRDAYEGRS
jgi:predicted 3-demethylubiquinone-9 3-methyltransferase (glyoxalase superfamily)